VLGNIRSRIIGHFLEFLYFRCYDSVTYIKLKLVNFLLMFTDFTPNWAPFRVSFFRCYDIVTYNKLNLMQMLFAQILRLIGRFLEFLYFRCYDRVTYKLNLMTIKFQCLIFFRKRPIRRKICKH
jgi:hypothetical protein